MESNCQPRMMLKAAIITRFGSQKAFAVRMGWTEQQVSQVIHNRRRVSREEMARAAMVLNKPLPMLFPEADG